MKTAHSEEAPRDRAVPELNREFALPEAEWPKALPSGHRSLLLGIRDGLRGRADIVGLAAGGSFVTGMLDGFSDLDLVLAVHPSAWPAVLERRHSIAAGLGPLLAAFTGEHVGEPRLLVCLYGPPLIHVDLKFVPLEALADRVEDPLLLWDRSDMLRQALAGSASSYPGPDRQWIEDRFWIWVHYAATKIARGELFEVLGFLGFLRARVLGPLVLAEAGVRPDGVRRLEQLAPARAAELRASVARHDRADAVRALNASIDLYLALRAAAPDRALEVRQSAQAATILFVRDLFGT